MAKYGKGLNKEIVDAINRGEIQNPFGIQDVILFTKNRGWNISLRHIGASLSNGCGRDCNGSRIKYFERFYHGAYRLDPKFIIKK